MNKIYQTAVTRATGTGPEVIREGGKELKSACGRCGFGWTVTGRPRGGEHCKAIWS